MLEKVARSIHALQGQLEFTKQYQDIGFQVPICQNLHVLVQKGKGHLSSSEVVLVEEDTDVLILADPLFEKVVSNLMDNVLRHSAGARHLAIRTEETDGKELLIFEDDGRGLSAEDRTHLSDEATARTPVFAFSCRERS